MHFFLRLIFHGYFASGKKWPLFLGRRFGVLAALWRFHADGGFFPGLLRTAFGKLFSCPGRIFSRLAALRSFRRKSPF
jgi:hypothetical protein